VLCIKTNINEVQFLGYPKMMVPSPFVSLVILFVQFTLWKRVTLSYSIAVQYCTHTISIHQLQRNQRVLCQRERLIHWIMFVPLNRLASYGAIREWTKCGKLNLWWLHAPHILNSWPLYSWRLLFINLGIFNSQVLTYSVPDPYWSAYDLPLSLFFWQLLFSTWLLFCNEHINARWTALPFLIELLLVSLSRLLLILMHLKLSIVPRQEDCFSDLNRFAGETFIQHASAGHPSNALRATLLL
jgi:hypothetical protein